MFHKIYKPETNNKSSGNDGLKAEFYKRFSNELTHALNFILLILKNQMQKALDTIIREHRSDTIKNRII